LVRKGEIEGRLDSFYYIPEIVELEKKVRNISNKRLKNFIISMASGATPAVREEEKFYSDAENGVPFIRVQNLSPTNELMINDLKYINSETHEKYLNRSQIKAGDLLVKITGVGRMAISSIVPDGFEGNINQHLVVIKTKDNFTSEVLATFLNTDIAEKLASRRATGGTRPALDYAALKSMPIVFKPEIVEIVKQAVILKSQKQAEAAALLASIDGYLLQELGITLPPPSEKKAFFYTRANKLSGGRFDPFYHQDEFEILGQALNNGHYEIHNFSYFITYISSGATPLKSNAEQYYTDDAINGIPLLRVQNITAEGLKLNDVIFINRETHEKELKRSQVFSGDLLITITGRIASSAVAPYSFEGNINQHSVIVRTHESLVLNEYLAIYFNSLLGQKLALRETTGGTRPALDYCALKSIKIPLPPLEKQTEIANHINAIRATAKQLQQQAEAELQHAKQQVERLILGE
jgi:restriction endonuclease S subunit